MSTLPSPAQLWGPQRQASESVVRSSDSLTAVASRPEVRGPYLYCGRQKLRLQGVTYGTFAANESGDLVPERSRVREDFRAMRAAGINCVRLYTLPPEWLLEEARAAQLWVILGVWWGGESCSFDDPSTASDAIDAVRQAVHRGRYFPDVVLAYAIGNEIPPLVVRYHGWRVIARFLRRLVRTIKSVDPDALVTYGNYPSTEYLQLDFLDFYTFNIYLLEESKLAPYLDRLLVQAEGKPVLLGEVGDDSQRRGEQRQAELLDWTLRLAMLRGVVGSCVFSWTDEWVVGGHAIEDWDFGLVDRQRNPKAALATVRSIYGQALSELRGAAWPKVSVVVCNYNGGATLAETLESLTELQYPAFEVIYVDDGSTDDSLEIASRFRDHPQCRIIAQENRGLSAARNVGAEAATGEIVAYIDSDAFADPDWLTHLVNTLLESGFTAVGGPNLTPASDGKTAQLIALCPGNPTCVLRDNREAEHIAGVNMAFRRDVLLELGGFNVIHRKAGDDVDICWRLMDAGYKIAYSPAAIVWHHRRPSIRRYFKQQYGYGEAENQLEFNHPERFNICGYIRWSGKIYGAPRTLSRWMQPFIYHGHRGEGMFQTLYQKSPSFLLDAPRMVQWYGVTLVLLGLGIWLPGALVVGGLMLAASAWSALFIGATTRSPSGTRNADLRLFEIVVISWLHFLHPVVRTSGRVAARVRAVARRGLRLPNMRWMSPRALAREAGAVLRRAKDSIGFWGVASRREEFLDRLIERGKQLGFAVARGREWDNNDLQLNGTLTCLAKIYTSPEHYGQGLRCGVKVVSVSPVRWCWWLFVLAALAIQQASGTWWAWLAPGLLLAFCAVERARLRGRTWEAIRGVGEDLGAAVYERGER